MKPDLFFTAVAITFAVLAPIPLPAATAPSSASAAPALKSVAARKFEICAGISDQVPARSNDWPLLLSQFSGVTPENCMKPAAIHPAQGVFNFREADAFVAFAETHHLTIVGHCLVWAKDDRTPAWFYAGATNGNPELLLNRMREHIETVAGRYRGRLAFWDVVNEALDDGTNYLRPSGWSQACGLEFLVQAFKIARQADPKPLLVYNDYNNEYGAKRDKLFKLVADLRTHGAPIQAIGLQGHYQLDQVPFADLETTLSRARTLKIKVVISELDIDVIPRSKWYAENGKYRDELARYDPYKDGCPPEILQRQAEQFGRLFRLFNQYRDVIARVTFWDLHDGQSWLNYFPWRRVNYPLLFDRELKPKPAFFEVVKALSSN